VCQLLNFYFFIENNYTCFAQNLVGCSWGPLFPPTLAWGSGCGDGREFRPGWERACTRTGGGRQTSAPCSPGTVSRCALAMHRSYVVCSGWLRKSPPEKKLRFCVSAGRGWHGPQLGVQQRPGRVDPGWLEGVRVASSGASGGVDPVAGGHQAAAQSQLQGLQDCAQTEQQVWPAEVGAAGPSPWGTVTSSRPDPSLTTDCNVEFVPYRSQIQCIVTVQATLP
jgi:hypothetical protein